MSLFLELFDVIYGEVDLALDFLHVSVSLVIPADC